MKNANNVFGYYDMIWPQHFRNGLKAWQTETRQKKLGLQDN